MYLDGYQFKSIVQPTHPTSDKGLDERDNGLLGTRMTEDQVRGIIKDESQKNQYKVPSVPYHLHNGIDSPKLPVESVILPPTLVIWGTGIPTIKATKGTLYVNTQATTTTTRLYVNTDGGTTWAYFTASA